MDLSAPLTRFMVHALAVQAMGQGTRLQLRCSSLSVHYTEPRERERSKDVYMHHLVCAAEGAAAVLVKAQLKSHVPWTNKLAQVAGIHLSGSKLVMQGCSVDMLVDVQPKGAGAARAAGGEAAAGHSLECAGVYVEDSSATLCDSALRGGQLMVVSGTLLAKRCLMAAPAYPALFALMSATVTLEDCEMSSQRAAAVGVLWSSMQHTICMSTWP